MIVREESLAGFSQDCQFDRYIKLGKGEEKSGGRDRDTILGDLFEAFLGALLLDQGVEAVKRFIYQVMIPKVETGQFFSSHWLQDPPARTVTGSRRCGDPIPSG